MPMSAPRLQPRRSKTGVVPRFNSARSSLWDVPAGRLAEGWPIPAVPRISSAPVRRATTIGSSPSGTSADRSVPPHRGAGTSRCRCRGHSRTRIAGRLGAKITPRTGRRTRSRSWPSCWMKTRRTTFRVRLIRDLKESLRQRPPRGVARTRDASWLVITPRRRDIRRVPHRGRDVPGHRSHSGSEGSATGDGRPVSLTRGPLAAAEIAERPEMDGGPTVLDLQPDERSRIRDGPETDGLRTISRFSPDGRKLAIWRAEWRNRLSIIDLATGQGKLDLYLGRDQRADLDYASRRTARALAIGTHEHEVRLWHLTTPPNPEIPPRTRPEGSMVGRFSPDGRTLASGGDDHCVRLWDFATGRSGRRLARPSRSLVTSLAFAPDGRTLASGSFDIKTPTRSSSGTRPRNSVVRPSGPHPPGPWGGFRPRQSHPRVRQQRLHDS